MQSNMKSAVVFDLYGTLVDFGLTLHPYKALLAGNASTAAFREAVMCRNLSIGELVAQTGLEASPETVRQCEADIEREVDEVHVYPEVFEVLHALREAGVKLVLCSNLAPAYGRVLKDTGLDQYFDMAQLSYQTGLLKPDPRMYLAALDYLGVGASNAVMVGDSYASDVVGALGAGLHAVHLQRKLPGSELVYSDLRQAADRAKQLLAIC